jgi:hypothetical protein
MSYAVAVAVQLVQSACSMQHAVCGMWPTSLCTIINQRVLVRQSRPTELIRRLQRIDEKIMICEMLPSFPLLTNPKYLARRLIGHIGREAYMRYVLY